MNTNDLKVLLQVARHGSFAKSARALGVDPSSVSRSIATLEDRIGVRLFQRTTRRLNLTESGKEFVERIAYVLDDFEDACQAALAITGAVKGRLRITAPSAFGVECLIPILPEFCRMHPDLELDLVFNDSVVDIILEGIDLAIRIAPLYDSTLVAVPVSNITYHAVASPTWKVSAGTRIDNPEHLAACPCLAISLPDRDRWVFTHRKDRSTLTVNVKSRIVASSGVAIRNLASAGLGPALLADWLVTSEIAAGRLIKLFPDYEASLTLAPEKVWAVYPSRSHVPLKVRKFLAFIKDHFG